MQNAGFGPRLGAYLIDAIILFVANLIIGFIFGAGIAGAASTGSDAGAAAALGGAILGYLILVVLSIVYFAYFWSSKSQATPGKMAVGLKVVDKNTGGRISFGKGILRVIGYYISGLILYIGFLMIAFTDKKEGLHDMIAGTGVVKK